ncbi:MAG: hypothetical protein R2788_19755 [Saprospiraceae bacterium]
MMSLPDERIEQNFDLNFYGNKLPEDAQFYVGRTPSTERRSDGLVQLL